MDCEEEDARLADCGYGTTYSCDQDAGLVCSKSEGDITHLLHDS